MCVVVCRALFHSRDVSTDYCANAFRKRKQKGGTMYVYSFMDMCGTQKRVNDRVLIIFGHRFIVQYDTADGFRLTEESSEKKKKLCVCV